MRVRVLVQAGWLRLEGRDASSKPWGAAVLEHDLVSSCVLVELPSVNLHLASDFDQTFASNRAICPYELKQSSAYFYYKSIP